MSKSLTEAERIDSTFQVTLGAQQRAIDDLYHLIAELNDSSHRIKFVRQDP